MSEEQKNTQGEEELKENAIQRKIRMMEGNSEPVQTEPRVYESDLSRRERRLLEKEKIKGMGLEKKIQYLWMYYKFVLFGLIGLIILGFVIRDWYENSKIESILTISVINGGLSEPELLEEEIRTLLGTTDKYEEVQISTSLNTDSTGKELDTNSQMVFVAQASVQGIDVLLAGEELLQGLTEADYLTELDQVLSPETLEKFGEDAKTYYVCLDGNKGLESLELGYPVYAAVLVNAKHPENAAVWLDAMSEEAYG